MVAHSVLLQTGLVLLAVLAIGLIFGPSGLIRNVLWTPYRAKPLVSDWERRALLAFRAQVPRGYYVCPQVRLADMLVTAGMREGRYTESFRRIMAKSVDFAIIELATGRVVLVVELDDRSHLRADRKRRDNMVEVALKAAEIPLKRFRPGQRLDVRDALA